MSYAVVKFLHENSDDEILVSEVPISWLTNNNTICKWPPEKYVSIYISKAFPPHEDWTEHPVEVEFICESLAEAKEKAAKGNSNEQNTEVGRGFRTSKPTDYFSPAEEEERFQEKIRRKGLPKKGFSANGLGVQDKTLEEDYQAAFMKHLIHPKSVDVLEESLSEVFDEREKEKETDLTTIRRKEVRNNIEDIFDKSDAENNTNTVNSALNESETTLQFTESSGKGVIVPCVSGDAVDQTSLPSTSSISASVIPDSDMISMNRKLDVIHKMMAKMSLDMNQLHEKMDGVFPDSKKDEDDALPFSFPLKTLTEIEKLEEFIKAKEENKMKYMRYLKGIGGHDFRDHILRICRSLFTNVLGETCSWLGRKQNFAVGHLEMTNIAYDVVHRKTRCTRKEFEHIFAEWLRHAKQRRLRETKN